MSREFKFRVWNVKDKEWDNPAILEVFSRNGVFRALYDPPENFVIQQYTCYKDKNGVEIYEGDRVKIPTMFTNLAGEPIFDYGIVEFCEYEDGEGYGDYTHVGWVAKGKNSYNDKYAGANQHDFRITIPDGHNNIEVVGNVFQTI